MRAIRTHLSTLLPVVEEDHVARMRLGLAHSLDRYKLKCNPDKIDTMIVQAIGTWWLVSNGVCRSVGRIG